MVNKTNVGSSFDGLSFMTKVYGMMSLSLLLSFATAYSLATSGIISSIHSFGYSLASTLALLAECALIWSIDSIAKKHPQQALITLLLFSIIDGGTMSIIFIAYPMKLIINAFAVATIVFACMSLIGLKIKKELNWGTQLLGATIALIVVELIEFFVVNSFIYMAFSGVGVILFSAYSIYDSQKIKELDADTNGSLGAVAVGALTLYIDITGLFEYLLTIFGFGSNNN